MRYCAFRVFAIQSGNKEATMLNCLCRPNTAAQRTFAMQTHQHNSGQANPRGLGCGSEPRQSSNMHACMHGAQTCQPDQLRNQTYLSAIFRSAMWVGNQAKPTRRCLLADAGVPISHRRLRPVLVFNQTGDVLGHASKASREYTVQTQ